MTEQARINFRRVAEAIEYIQVHFREQPSLEEVAAKVHLSPFHFQRLFVEWAGVSPKKFLQYISLAHAKRVLQDRSSSLFHAALETGLSGTSRLHDLFIHIEGMSPGEYRKGGEKLAINYSFADSLFGEILIASTQKGICHLAFSEERDFSLQRLQNAFPKAHLIQQRDKLQEEALSPLSGTGLSFPGQIKLHLRASEFQIKVWEALLQIPAGQLASYRDVAKQISQPSAARAVGNAIGSNPIAFLIPCHRVIQASGLIGGYMWGPVRKTAIIGWEAAKFSQAPGVGEGLFFNER